MKEKNELTVFAKGMQQSEHFTGAAFLEVLSATDDIFDVLVGNVTFEPGVRNDWHIHHGYQILLAIKGTGYYQEEGKPAQLLQPGDVVRIATGVKHWHGATADEEFAHLIVAKGETTWLEPVTDEQYQNLVVE